VLIGLYNEVLMKPVIICGGVGAKMWPASRKKSPKHFLPLLKGKSLFQWNWESLRKKFDAKDIYVQTTAEQADLVRKQVSEVLLENIFVEPELRNQGPATGFAAAMLYKIDPDEPFMLVQVDDIRIPEQYFFETMDVCDRLARTTKKYITGGFRPAFAITGNDWLIKGELETEQDRVGVYKVEKFLWRGAGENAKKQAEQYFNEGLALLHTNHTCMTPRSFLEMFKKYRMEWYTPLMNIIEGGDVVQEYAKMPKGQLEDVTQLVHAAGESLVVELPFRWIDIGTWESADIYLKEVGIHTHDENVIEIDSDDNFIQAPKEKIVATIGINNIIVIDTGDALLICRKDQSGRVGEVVERLKLEGKTELL
jgi:mannose-1-phosphate guanylyltransferase